MAIAAHLRPIPIPINDWRRCRPDATRHQGRSGRQTYLAAVDGMSVDDPPEEGFVRGTTFEHPVMSLALGIAGFYASNDHNGVLGIGRDRSLLFFSAPAKRCQVP